MFVSQQGKQFIKSYERGPNGGAALVPYYDARPYIDYKKLSPNDSSNGFLTIGWGHVIVAGENYTEITQTQADELFEKDLYRKSVKIIEKLVRVPLTQNQLDALASYVYNTGSLHGTHLLTYINRKEYKKAVLEMDIKTSNGKVMNGLIKRRNAEHDIWNLAKYVNH